MRLLPFFAIVVIGCGGADGGAVDFPTLDDSGATSTTETGVFNAPLLPVPDAAFDTQPAIDTAPVEPGPPPESVKKVLTYAWKGQETGYWCGPGSTRIALSSRLADPPSQSTLASYMGTDTDGTDHISLVCNALNKWLGTSQYKSRDMYDPPTTAQREGLKRDILELIGSGWPIVANVISGWRPPGYPSGTIYHYVAVMGYDEGGEKVLIADPAGGAAAGSSWSKVPQSYWISLNDLGTWIGGKGYTGH